MPPPTRTFVVSLAGSPRRATFSRRAADAKIEWAFFDACGGVASDLEYDEPGAVIHTGRGLSRSELGCYASHYLLWQRLLADDAEQYIVLEDDVIADWAMLGRVAGIDFAASGVPYLRLYHKAPPRFILRRRHYLARSSSLIELTSEAYGTQGYVVTRAAAETLVRHCRRVTRPIDVELDRFWAHGVPNLCLIPFPVIEEAGTSVIGHDRFGGLAKQTSLRRKAHLLREIAGRRLAAARRRRYRRDWTPIPFDPDGA